MRLGTARDFWELVWALAKVGFGILTGLATVAVGVFLYEFFAH